MSENTPTIRIEQSAKRVRAFLGGQVAVDTLEPRLVWEVPYYPQYYIPRADVNAELEPTGRSRTSRTRGVGSLYTVRAGDAEAEEAAVIYGDSPHVELADLVRFTWDAMDAWFEENEEVFTHPRSPYTRVDILPTSRHVAVRAGTVTVAESTRSHVVYETGLPPRYYLPKVDVRMDILRKTGHVTHCPYKGQTVYWSVRGDELLENAGWSYPQPLPESVRIAGLVSFDPAKVDVIVNGVTLASH